MAFEAFVALVIFFSDSDYLKLCLLTWFCMLSISMACLNFSCCSGLSCCCATSPPPPPSFFEAFPPFPENFISFQLSILYLLFLAPFLLPLRALFVKSLATTRGVDLFSPSSLPDCCHRPRLRLSHSPPPGLSQPYLTLSER